MAMYVSQYRNYPTPVGQPGFNRSLTDWNNSRHRNDGLIPAPALANTPTEIYLFGTGAWWVGVLTNDPRWYNRQAFQCTTNTTTYAESYMARGPGYAGNTAYGELCSNIGGQITFNPSTYDAPKQPWYVYMHPFVCDYMFYDWWDSQHAGDDWAKLLFQDPSSLKYRVSPSNQIVGARLKHTRRPQFSCPTVALFPPGAPRRFVIEPHGRALHTGYQNSRNVPDVEDKSYLYTDGSVVAVRR